MNAASTLIACLACFALLMGCIFLQFQGSGGQTGKEEVRIGYFPNMLHGQALVGCANGAFQEAFGPNVTVRMVPFNAGPSAIEALFAGELDLAYIGPNPAINGYVKSGGDALCIIAGGASGGAVLVVRNDSGISSDADFAGKTLASPQLGNTQDVALRSYIQNAGLKIGEGPGGVRVIPTANPDILLLFQKKEIDGAWVPEPWGARLVQEGGGRIYIDERELWPDGKFVTANVIASKEFMGRHPDLVKRFLEAHVELTRWINGHPEEAKALINGQIRNITSKALAPEEMDAAFSRCDMTYDPVKSSLAKSADDAYALGFLGAEKPDLSGIYSLSLLNEVLREKGLEEIG
ncbi:MAG: ABC transporter substrate-binding protein [Candidatus ainarchaeum sp.]|nr:ABC transporter substrate-binding protein [Candidatus ainarchaeum sp.]